MSNPTLASYDDDALLTELAWRGYRIEDHVGPGPTETVKRMSAGKFMQNLERDYRVPMRGGRRRMMLWQALLNSFPEVCHYDRMIPFIYQGEDKTCEEQKTINALVCIENRSLNGSPYHIENAHGMGYRLVVDRSGSH